MDASANTRVHFPETRWSLVAHVREDQPDADAAMEDLCSSYWPPLYQFIRRKGYDPHDAEDLTQSFFSLVLKKELLSSADQEKGRMRTYLLTALQRFLANEYHREHAQKRGGGVQHESFDTTVEEARFVRSEPLEMNFDHHWAVTLLDQVITTLNDEYENAGNQAVFHALKTSLTSPSFDNVAAAELLDMEEGSVRVGVHRLRKRFRSLFHEAVERTVSDPADVPDELRYLAQALGAVE